MTRAMKTLFERLPAELIDNVIHWLDSHDFQQLRLASPTIARISSATFANVHFSSCTTTLGASSLTRLLEIARTRSLAPSITSLNIVLWSQEEYQIFREISNVGIFPPPKRFPKIPSARNIDYRDEATLFEDMLSTKGTSKVTVRLIQVLKDLRSLQTIHVSVNESTIRHTGLVSLSWATPYQPTSTRADFNTFLSFCFHAILGSIIRSQSAVQSLTLVEGPSVRGSSRSTNLIWSAFDFPATLFKSLVGSRCSLRAVWLSVRTKDPSGDRAPGWENGIPKFLSALPHMEDLTLCFQPADGAPNHRLAVMRAFATHVRPSKLKTLRLFGAAISMQSLLAICGSHAHTLRSLTMRECVLYEGAWVTVLETFRDKLDLVSLKMSYLQQLTAPRDVWWLRDSKMRSSPKTRFDSSQDPAGKTMSEWLDERITSLLRMHRSRSTSPPGIFAYMLKYPAG